MIALESDGLAVFGDRFIQLTRALRAKPRLLDQGEIGFEPDGLAVFGDLFIRLTLGPRVTPRLLWASA